MIFLLYYMYATKYHGTIGGRDCIILDPIFRSPIRVALHSLPSPCFRFTVFRLSPRFIMIHPQCNTRPVAGQLLLQVLFEREHSVSYTRPVAVQAFVLVFLSVGSLLWLNISCKFQRWCWCCYALVHYYG